MPLSSNAVWVPASPGEGSVWGRRAAGGEPGGPGYAGVQVTEEGAVPDPVPVKPKVVLAPAFRLPFQDRFFTVTFDPLWL